MYQRMAYTLARRPNRRGRLDNIGDQIKGSHGSGHEKRPHRSFLELSLFIERVWDS